MDSVKSILFQGIIASLGAPCSEQERRMEQFLKKV